MNTFTIKPLQFNGTFLIESNYYKDNRGIFARIFCSAELNEILGPREIVQINYSCTQKKGTVRGFHFQYPPKAEMKIIRCLKGSIFDVLVDIRINSPTFLQWLSIILTNKSFEMICIPEGFAHGFQTLENDVELLYLHTEKYSPDNEGRLSVFDPSIGVKWPLDITVISDIDKKTKYIDNDFRGVVL